MSCGPVEIPVTLFGWLPKGCPLRCFYVGKDIHLEEDWTNPNNPEGRIQGFPVENLTVWLDLPGELRHFVPVILRRHFNLKGEPSALYDDVNDCYVLIWPDELWRRIPTATVPECSGDTVEECLMAAMRILHDKSIPTEDSGDMAGGFLSTLRIDP